jgi:pimeloyl-ACP methyl ester carboxylesterase
MENMLRVNQQFELPDGRLLGYNEYGATNSRPMLYFHGTPGARNEWDLWGGEALAQKFDLHVITLDRPGIGLSSFQPGRRIDDWVADVTSLADGLGLECFIVLGYSAGGPYVAACALKIPERITSVGIVSGMGPHNVPDLVDGINPYSLLFIKLARDNPMLSKWMLILLKFMNHYMSHVFTSLAMSKLPESDKRALANAKVQRICRQVTLESMRNGPHGVQVDTALIANPWGFCPQKIDTLVHLWYGESDITVPSTMGRYLAATFAKCSATFYPGEGHLSTFFNHIEDILGALTSKPEMDEDDVRSKVD